jgi:hypothetical protein
MLNFRDQRIRALEAKADVGIFVLLEYIREACFNSMKAESEVVLTVSSDRNNYLPISSTKGLD